MRYCIRIQVQSFIILPILHTVHRHRFLYKEIELTSHVILTLPRSSACSLAIQRYHLGWWSYSGGTEGSD